MKVKLYSIVCVFLTSFVQTVIADTKVSEIEIAVKNSLDFYMDEECVSNRTYPKWEEFPVQFCSYGVTDLDGTRKTASVFLLNPTAKQAAAWIKTACQNSSEVNNCHTYLIKRIKKASGYQFPVAGVVYEDLFDKAGNRKSDGVYEAYCFRDGVTVKVVGFEHRKTEKLSSQDIQTCLDGAPQSALQYARIHNGTRGDYTRSGGVVDVGSSEKQRLVWLEVVQQSYQAAWNSNSYSLLNAAVEW